MKPLISIIIPVYNVEQYLDYCMESVLVQDYKNLEIILIDDGSTDSSGNMCDEYAKNDSRVKVIHKKNGGLSSARNIGIEVMTGKYLTFVDSDDYIRIDYVSRMYKYILEDDTDLVVCSYKKILGEESYRNISNRRTQHYVYDAEMVRYKMIARQIPMYAHGKLYRARLIGWLNFPEGRLYEDVPTIWNVVKHIEKVTYATDELYFYRQRVDSIVNGKYKHRRMDQVYFAEQIYDEVKNVQELKYAAGTKCFFSAVDNYALVSEKFPDDKKYLENVIRRFRGEVVKDSSAEKNLKIMALVSYFNLRLVRILGRLYKKSNYRKWKNAK